MKKVNEIDVVNIQKTSFKPDRLSGLQFVGAMIPIIQFFVLVFILLKKADEFIEKSEKYRAQLLLCQLMYFTEKYIKNNDPDGRQIATEAAESNAPPTAPPDSNASPAPLSNVDFTTIYDTKNRDILVDKLKNILEILYFPNFQNKNTDFYDENYVNPDFLTGDIKEKILIALTQHATNYQNFYPAIFKNWTQETETQTQNFINFKILQFFKDICRETVNANRTEPLMLKARETLICFGAMVSIDTKFSCKDGSNDTTLHDILRDENAIDPLDFALLSEIEMIEINSYIHESNEAECAEPPLFKYSTADEMPQQSEFKIKPRRPRTGRAKQQLSLFGEAV